MQRAAVCRAVLHDPPILLLDEPFNGLDPEGIVWMRGLLRELAAEGRAVFVCSHLMGELQDMAAHVVVIGRGRLVADTSVAALLTSASRGLVRLRTAEPAQATALLTGDGATVVAAGTDALTVSGLPSERVVELLGENAVPFSEVSLQRATLEEAYMELTREAVEFRAAEAEEASR